MKNNKGFTLMEMLIVVAIIAVLVAIAIPTMTGALEKSREATDAANLRSAYAEVMVMALTEDTAKHTIGSKVTCEGKTENGKTTYTAEITAVQKQAGWQTTSLGEAGAIGGMDAVPGTTKTSGDIWVITFEEGKDTPTCKLKTAGAGA